MNGYVGNKSSVALYDSYTKAQTYSKTEINSTPFSFKNKLINGNFDIWQRGNSQTTDGYGSDDRWTNSHSGSTKTHSLQSFILGQTEVPGNPKYFSRTIVSSVAGAGNYIIKGQRIESVHTLAEKTATLSFYAKADANKNIAVDFVQGYGTGGTPSPIEDGIGVTTFALTTTWQKYTVTVEIPSIAGKTLGSDGNDFLALLFWFDAGTTYNSRTNFLGQQSGTFDIAQVQLEEGSVATSFEERPLGLELSLCQRYFEQNRIMQTVSGSTYFGCLFSYKVSKRSETTITWTDLVGNPNKVSVGGINNFSGLAGGGIAGGRDGVIVDMVASNNLTANTWWSILFTASAEL